MDDESLAMIDALVQQQKKFGRWDFNKVMTVTLCVSRT